MPRTPRVLSQRVSAPAHSRPVTTNPVLTPGDAAELIIAEFRTIGTGIVVLLVDVDHVPLLGLAVRGAPRNDFEPIVSLLGELHDDRLASVIVGVLSPAASFEITADGVPDTILGDLPESLSDRLFVEAATVTAWATLAESLADRGLTLLDVIECDPLGWASVHAPQALYRQRVSAAAGVAAISARMSARAPGIDRNGE
jgi:hypothetical protein